MIRGPPDGNCLEMLKAIKCSQCYRAFCSCRCSSLFLFLYINNLKSVGATSTLCIFSGILISVLSNYALLMLYYIYIHIIFILYYVLYSIVYFWDETKAWIELDWTEYFLEVKSNWIIEKNSWQNPKFDLVWDGGSDLKRWYWYAWMSSPFSCFSSCSRNFSCSMIQSLDPHFEQNYKFGCYKFKNFQLYSLQTNFGPSVGS